MLKRPPLLGRDVMAAKKMTVVHTFTTSSPARTGLSHHAKQGTYALVYVCVCVPTGCHPEEHVKRHGGAQTQVC